MEFDSQKLLGDLVLLYIPTVLSLACHEWGHAASAVALGDQTPREQGRLTFNPVAHMDMLGTVMLPLALIAAGQPPFGWAKPVEITPYRFTRKVRMRTGVMLTAAAGPLMNLLLAALAVVVFIGMDAHYGRAADWPGGARLHEILPRLALVNVALFLFNLMPVPPLDGSRVLGGLMPPPLRAGYAQFERFAPFLMAPLLFFGGSWLAAPEKWLMERLIGLATLLFP